MQMSEGEHVSLLSEAAQDRGQEARERKEGEERQGREAGEGNAPLFSSAYQNWLTGNPTSSSRPSVPSTHSDPPLIPHPHAAHSPRSLGLHTGS